MMIQLFKKYRATQYRKRAGGYAFLVAIIVTSLLLIISLAVLNVSLRSLVLSYADQESQHAFYNADNGIECAMYWDMVNGGSAFDPSTPGTITCNNQTISTGSQSVPTNPSVPSRIGGGGASNPVSIFSINFTRGCVVVWVIKSTTNIYTTIYSRGYNTCDTSSVKRYERGITITY